MSWIYGIDVRPGLMALRRLRDIDRLCLPKMSHSIVLPVLAPRY